MQRLDSVFVAETPEGIQLHLRVAGLTPRVLAALVDFIILVAAAYVVMILGAVLMAAVDESIMGFMFIALLVIWWFYPVLCETLFRGRTIGKLALGLMVVQTNGAPVGWRNSINRAVLLSIDYFPLVSVPLMLWSRKFQRLGDLVADTMVIYVPRGQTSHALPDVDPVAAGVFLPEENQAILALAQRHYSLAPQRSLDIVEPLAVAWGISAESALGKAYGHARFIVGATK